MCLPMSAEFATHLVSFAITEQNKFIFYVRFGTLLVSAMCLLFNAFLFSCVNIWCYRVLSFQFSIAVLYCSYLQQFFCHK